MAKKVVKTNEKKLKLKVKGRPKKDKKEEDKVPIKRITNNAVYSISDENGSFKLAKYFPDIYISVLNPDLKRDHAEELKITKARDTEIYELLPELKDLDTSRREATKKKEKKAISERMNKLKEENKEAIEEIRKRYNKLINDLEYNKAASELNHSISTDACNLVDMCIDEFKQQIYESLSDGLNNSTLTTIKHQQIHRLLGNFPLEISVPLRKGGVEALANYNKNRS